MLISGRFLLPFLLTFSLPGESAKPPRAPAIPLYFEENRGQMDGDVLFTARGAGYTVSLTGRETRIAIRDASAVRFTLAGSRPAHRIQGVEKLPGVVNWYRGDRSRWREGIATWQQVRYTGVYPGVDLVYYGNRTRLEFDFEIAPGADPRRIELAYRGARRVRIDDDGNLILDTPAGALTQHRPVAYQWIAGRRVEVSATYRLSAGQRAGFQLGPYDRSHALVIDPSVSYFAYLGDTGGDYASGVAVRPTTGEAYVVGTRDSDNVVYHMNAAGTALLYTTVLPTVVSADAIAVNAAGEAWVVGETENTLTPVKAFQGTYGGGYYDAFVIKLSSAGALQVASYLGSVGADQATAVAVDSAGNAYVAGSVTDFTESVSFPVTAGAAITSIPGQSSIGAGVENGFVAKIVPPAGAGNATKAWATLIGGPNYLVTPLTTLAGIAVDPSGSSYVIGSTTAGTIQSATTIAHTWQMTNAGVPIQSGMNNYSLGFILKLAADGSAIDYLGYLGGSVPTFHCALCGDFGPRTFANAVAVSSDGVAYVAGNTQASNLQTTSDAYKTTKTSRGYVLDTAGNIDYDAFVLKVKADGTGLLYSTYLGGSTIATSADTNYIDQWVQGIAVDSANQFFVVGGTNSSNFPTTQGLSAPFSQGFIGGTEDAFISKFTSSGALLWSSYVGTAGDDYATAVSYNGTDVIVAGNTDTSGANSGGSPGYHGGQDMFLARLLDAAPIGTTMTVAPQSANFNPASQAVALTSTITPASGTVNTGTVTYTVTSGASQVGTPVTSGTVTGNAAPAVNYTLPAGAAMGSYTITGFYNPAGGFAANSGTATLTVNPAATTTSISASAGAVVYGQSVTLTATVASVAGTPTGSVAFYRDGSAMGSPVTLAGGQASLTVSDSSVSSTPHSFTAAYHSSSGNYSDSSTVSAASVTVNRADTSLALTASNLAPKVAETVTFTATLSVTSPGGGSPAGGSVQFLNADTSAVLATVALASNSGSYQAQYAPSFSSGGVYHISVQYLQSASYNSSSASPVTVTVVSAPVMALSFGASSIPVGGTTSLVYTITNPNGGSVSLSGVAFASSLSAGLVIATPNNLGNTCGGTGTATAGSSSVSLSAGALAAGASCAVSLNVTGTSAGVKSVSATATSVEGGAGSAASANITVATQATIAIAFGATSVPLNGSTTLTFTVANPNATLALSGVGFTDTLPAGLAVGSVVAGSTCTTGTITVSAANNRVTWAGGSLGTAASCTFSVNVTGAAAGDQVDTTGAIGSTEGGTGLTAQATLTVVAPPAIAKAFAPSAIRIGGTSVLTFTLANPAVNTVALTNVGFSDPLPQGSSLVVATPPGLAGTCNGSITAQAGASSISLSGATLAPGSACSFSVNLAQTSPVAGTYANTTGAVTSSNGGTGRTASATLTVAGPPTIAKAFGAAAFVATGTTSLSFTLVNTNATMALTGVGFTDTLPAGLFVATPNGLTGSCGGGTIAAAAGGTTVSLSGASLPAATGCTFSVNVTGSIAGQRNNTTGNVTSIEGGNGGTASASVTINPGPASVFVVAAPASATSGVPFSFTVTAKDQSGNTATAYTGPVHFSSSDFQATLPPDATLAGGTGTFTATLAPRLTPGQVGNATITASDAAHPSVTGTSGKIAVAGQPDFHLVVSAPSTATAGVAFGVAVTARDNNNDLVNYAGAVQVSSTDGAALLPANFSLSGGTGAFTVTLKTAGSQTIRVGDISTPAISGTSNAIAVGSAAATRFRVTAPATTGAGMAFSFTVTALDAYNNTAAGYAGTVRFSGGGGSASLPPDSTLTNGTGAFQATLRALGSQTISAADVAAPGIAGVSGAIAVAALPATHFAVIAPPSVSDGIPFTFTVTALDANNNVVTGYPGTVQFSSNTPGSNSRPMLPNSTTLTNGTGTFRAILSGAPATGSITVTDAANPQIAGTSNTINLTR